MLPYTFIRIDYGSERYAQAIALRYQVLRQPIGLSMQDLNPAQEARMQHFGMHTEGTLIACVVALGTENNIAIIRQMAVADTYRGLGIGSMMLKYAEQQLREQGIVTCKLSARVSALSFYQAAGYHIDGEEYISVTLPHRWMSKHLLP